MTQRTFFLIAAAVFSLIALGHAIRLLFGWQITIGDVVVPLWVSWIGLAIAGYLAYKTSFVTQEEGSIRRCRRTLRATAAEPEFYRSC